MKIEIRTARRGDASGIAKSFNEGLKRNYNTQTGRNHLFNEQRIEKMNEEFSRYYKYKCTYVAIDKDNKEIIGNALFYGKERGRLRHRVEFGWFVHPDYSNKGIGTKLVKKLISEAKNRGFKRIEAEVSVTNIPSIKLAKRLGFKNEGIRKKGLLLDNGRYVNTYLFGKILS